MRIRLVVQASFLALASAAVGQQAIQWRVEIGGNGHWYAADPVSRGWAAAQAAARARGGHLATMTSAAETAFVVASQGVLAVDRPWLGGFQDLNAPHYAEPAGGWRWVTGEPWDYTQWGVAEPNDAGNEHWLHFDVPTGLWNDHAGSWPSIIEWSADCDGNGVIDHGEVLDGTLEDADSNGVPDCCEQGTPCERCAGDLNGDRTTNGADLSVLLGFWGLSGKSVLGDLDGNHFVDAADLAALLASWGPCP